jgi:flavin-dependent dehydrogenase
MDVAARFPRRELPVLWSADVAVIGGSIAGVAAAVALARAGRRTILLESRTFLGADMTATLRPWLPASPVRGSFWDEVLHRLDIVAGLEEIPLPMGALKRTLEDLLLDAGVELLYASTAVGLLPGGIVIGNKSGRQVIDAGLIVDATETALATRLAGVHFLSPAVVSYRRTLEFDGVRGAAGQVVPVPAAIGIPESRVETHAGYRGREHVFVEFALELPYEDSPDGYMAREIAARQAGMALAAYLIREVPAFREAVLGSASLELFGPHAFPVLDEGSDRPDLRVLAPWYADPHEAAAAGVEFAERVMVAVDGDFAPQNVGAICNRPPRSSAASCPVTPGYLGPYRIKILAGPETSCPGDRKPARRPAGDSKSPLHMTWHPAGLRVAEQDSPQRGRDYRRIDVPPTPIPTLVDCAVLVAGGGTSGATAAITAAGEGLETVLLEMSSGPGGTGTLGGVNSYWYGRHAGFSAQVERRTAEEQAKLGYASPKWNIESKMYALLSDAVRAGAQVYFRAVAIGALMRGNRVCGVAAATPWGPMAVRARVTVDTTGDADIAAFAGAPTVYGAERDHSVMWFSVGQFTTPGRTRNNFTSMCDVTNIEDYTRGILAGRRRGSNVHDHGVYLAPRETRHIVGEAVMTHTDQLRRRRWPDTVNIHYSNHDVKGVSTSPWVRMGLIPPNLEIEVPYRMLLPQGIDGLIVAGKAVSATHDALPAIRMQADMENLGGVAALAAAQAVRTGVEPRRIDVPALQSRLRREGVLPEGVPSSMPASERKSLQDLVDAIDGARPLYDYSDMEMGEIYEGTIPMVEACTAGPEIVPVLLRAMDGAAGLRRVHLAQALAMYGVPEASPILIEEIERLLAGGRLPQRDSAIRHAGYPPDQGAMPDIVYLLYSLGMLRDPRAIPVWERLACLLQPTEEGIRDRREGIFYYVEALAWSAEQLGDPAAIPMLRRLHAFPVLRGQVSHERFEPDFFLERQGMLELMLARALARCGAEEGFETLIDYLDDARALLAEQAHDHLVALTGADAGKDRERWRHVLGAREPGLAEQRPQHSANAPTMPGTRCAFVAATTGGWDGSDEDPRAEGPAASK